MELLFFFQLDKKLVTVYIPPQKNKSLYFPSATIENEKLIFQ